MKFKDLKIGTQLMIGFCAILILVATLGIVSYIQANKIHQQTDNLYNHPQQVRRAIGALEADILKMRLSTRDLMLADDAKEKQASIELMQIAELDAIEQFKIIDDLYLGPHADVDEAQKAFVIWKVARDENTKLALSGELEAVKASLLPAGKVGNLREKMMAKIGIIDNFARNKGDSLYADSIKIKDDLRMQLTLIVVAILFLTIIIGLFLLGNIRTPMVELTNAIKRFYDGDTEARCEIHTNNEFGILSSSFNSMLDNIQLNNEMSEKASNISTQMLLENDAHKFFQSLLPILSDYTNSQMAAVYLLSNNKKKYIHYESIGLSGDNAKMEFSADGFEGEFGSVLRSHKIQTVKNIPLETRFVYHTVSGKIIPREIITIPIFSNSEIVAIISLASVRNYSDLSNLLINNIYNTLNARIEGVLNFRKIKDYSVLQAAQNLELETQKTQLESQSTELIEQNRELEAQKIQLNEASRLKTNFLSNMSHELRTPLNSVIALSGVLNRRLVDKIPEDEYSYLEVIERNGKHLLSLINDILDISRIEAGREEIEISTFNINNLLSEVVEMIKPQSDGKNIQLIHAVNQQDIQLNSDSAKCRHILQNLIANAVKFTDTGSVEVTAIEEDDVVCITVTDTGIGISEKNMSHIFDEFRQADGSTSRRFGGTGLGLAIAKKYANLLGGTITVSSTEGSGSEFILSLPLKFSGENYIKVTQTEVANIFPTKKINLPITNSKKTILLVEDSEPAIIQIKDFMEESGYNIIIARDGQQALDIIEDTIPDAIILDLMMPVVDGFQVLESIRNADSTAQIPVLILTAKQITKEDLKFLKRNNVHQLIQKGDVNRIELLNSVASLFETEVEVVDSLKIKTDGKQVVLVVEDNPDNMTTVKALLNNKYVIVEAMDGVQAISQAKKFIPDLILMDIALPGVDGIQAFKTIRKNSKLTHIPIIAITASAMTSDRETVLAHGFEAYIPKPIDEKVFFSTINKVLFGK
jgi:signal transduction histidine kinase/CheY-like chemotaxis protein/HAMP domain-containing protein